MKKMTERQLAKWEKTRDIGVLKALVILAFTWLFLRAIDVMATRAQRRFVQRRQLGAVSIIPLGRRVLKITVAVLTGVTN